MIKLGQVTGVLALGIAWSSIAWSQAQETPRFSRDFCVKVRDGKAAEYAAYLRDVTTKLAKVRVESGMYSSFVLAESVVPAGRSARCDYHIVYGSIGFPPESPSAEQTVADMKKAGITMTREAMVAKRDDLSFLVSTDIWRAQTGVGRTEKGGYARLNYYKTKPGMAGEWVRMETTGWKLLAESVATSMPGTSWGASTLAMPGGDNLPYNAMTYDGFPSWVALGKGLPVRETWNKVHPEMDMATYTNRMATVVDRPRIDVVKLIEVIRAN